LHFDRVSDGQMAHILGVKQKKKIPFCTFEQIIKKANKNWTHFLKIDKAKSTKIF
jgi:hypothetical protein